MGYIGQGLVHIRQGLVHMGDMRDVSGVVAVHREGARHIEGAGKAIGHSLNARAHRSGWSKSVCGFGAPLGLVHVKGMQDMLGGWDTHGQGPWHVGDVQDVPGVVAACLEGVGCVETHRRMCAACGMGQVVSVEGGSTL